MSLKSNFKDQIPVGGKRLYQVIDDSTGGIIYNKVRIDRANGNSQEGDKYGAAEVNEERNVINQLSNPNLLINGDFQVWQRGEKFGGSKVKTYVADRWWYYNVDGVISKVSDGLQTNCAIHQNLENKLRKGKKYTISYSKNGVVFKRVITAQIYDSDYIENIKYFLNSNGYEEVAIRVDNTCILNWVKLELGDTETPLIPRPYAEELAMCHRYYQSYTSGWMFLCAVNVATVNGFTFFTEMRVVPTIRSQQTLKNDGVTDIIAELYDITKFGLKRIGFSLNANLTNSFIYFQADFDAEIY